MNLIQFILNKRIYILSCADVEADVGAVKNAVPLATYENVTCHTRVHVRMCAHVCVRVRVCD